MLGGMLLRYYLSTIEYVHALGQTVQGRRGIYLMAHHDTRQRVHAHLGDCGCCGGVDAVGHRPAVEQNGLLATCVAGKARVAGIELYLAGRKALIIYMCGSTRYGYGPLGLGRGGLGGSI